MSDDEPILAEIVDDGPAEGAPAEDALAALGGAGMGGLDLGAMMQMAQDMGDRMAQAQERLSEARVDGSAGGGVVTVTLDGHLHLLRVDIDPSVVDPDDVAMLGDLIVAAWTDAQAGVARLQAESDPLGGMGGLGGLMGGT
jgi:DNA-binding YbaB/EbfC family protein